MASKLDQAGVIKDMQAEVLSNVQIAAKYGVSDWTIGSWRKKLADNHAFVPGGRPAPSTVADGQSGFEEDSNGARSVTAVRDRPVTLEDARAWIRATGDDPDEYTLSIRSIAYGQDMFSNRMSAVPKHRKSSDDSISLPDADIARLVDAARGWRLPDAPAKQSGVPVAAVLNISDMQLFKAEGGGVKATLERLQVALTSFRADIERHRSLGVNINELVIVNNGDPFEGIAGNYANQSHTVEGGLRAQMNAVLDVWLMFARELYPLFEKRQFVSVLCNHAQFGRQGGAKDSITGDEDNGSAFLAETLQRILDVTPGMDDVRFTIPYDEMNVYTEAAGIPLGFNHGHKIPKSDASGFESWLNNQVRADRQAYDVRVWVTAHRHNFQMFDIGSASVLQCPSCDGGSKWLTDRTGTHSNAGVVSILVGEHHRLGWSDVAFL